MFCFVDHNLEEKNMRLILSSKMMYFKNYTLRTEHQNEKVQCARETVCA